MLLVTTAIFWLLLLFCVILLRKVQYVIFYVFAFLVFILTFSTFLGLPRDSRLDIFGTKYKVLWHKSLPQQGIYMTVQPLDSGIPRLIYVPWTPEMDQELAQMEERKKRLGGYMVIENTLGINKMKFKLTDKEKEDGN